MADWTSSASGLVRDIQKKLVPKKAKKAKKANLKESTEKFCNRLIERCSKKKM